MTDILTSIGSFYAFILSRVPGVRLSVVARSNYEPVKENGIIMKSDNHGEHVVRPYKGAFTSVNLLARNQSF